MAINTPSTKYERTVDLGYTTVNLRKWKAKDLKIFDDVLENSYDIEDLTHEQLISLVTPCIEDYKDMYYSDFELTYMLYNIREISLGKTMKFEYLCEQCDVELDINIDFSKNVTFEPFSDFIIELNNLKFYLNNKISNTVLMEKIKEYPNESEILLEFILRTEKFEHQEELQDSYTFEELLTYINDTLDIEEYNELITKFIEVTPYTELSGTYVCKECGYEHNIDFDIIPGFFGKF